MKRYLGHCNIHFYLHVRLRKLKINKTNLVEIKFWDIYRKIRLC